MASKPQLSREYLYVPLADMNFTMAEVNVAQMAFKLAGVAPAEGDWIDALTVDAADELYIDEFGESLALLIGPDRGDSVTTEELANGDWQVWVDIGITGSDERVVRVAGVLSIDVDG